MFSYEEVRRPYPGLRPFEPYEAEIFFGREAHVERLLEILKERRFLAVIGPSGCGKSSLVRAGLLPAVAAGLLETGSDWRLVMMRPGDRPLRELARALGGAHGLGDECGGAESVSLIETELARGRRGLVDVFRVAARRASNPQRLNLLVLVDQFEELFTYARAGTAQADESADFVNLLLSAAAEDDVRIHVVLTMRTDFLGHCVRFLDLPDAINRGMFLTPRLNRDEMRTAVVGPAALFGGSVDGQLAGQLINGVGGDSDELPILQHALSRVWENATEKRGSTTMLPEDLEAIGGLEHALSAHADAVYNGLPEELQPLTKKLFQFITERTSAAEGSQDVRRARPLHEIAAATGCEWSTLEPIVKAFAADGVNFLTHGAGIGPDSVIDISHEALIRKWDRLQKWVAEEAVRAGGYHRWRDRAATGTVLPTVEMLQAVRWREGGESRERPDAKWALRYGSAHDFDATLAYIAASEKADARSRRAKQWRRLSLALAALVAVFAFALIQRKDAQVQAANALSYQTKLNAELDAQKLREAKEKADEERDEAVHAAQERALATANAKADAANAQAEKQAEALKRLKAQRGEELAKTETLQAKARQLMSESQIYARDDPERSQLLAVEAYERFHRFPDSESMIRAVGMRYASLLHTLREAGKVRRTAFDPNGKTLLTVGADGKVHIWETASGERASTLAISGKSLIDAAYDSKGKLILTISNDRVVRVWDAATGRPVASFQHQSSVYRAAFSPNSRYVAVASGDKTAQVWDISTGKAAASLIGHTTALSDVAYSPNGKMIATASRDKTVRLWDASNGTQLLPEIKPTDFVRRIVFSADSTRLLTLNALGPNAVGGAQIWDTATRTQVGEPLNRGVVVNQAAFSPDGKTIVTAAADGTAKTWRADTGEQLATLVENGPRLAVHDVSFSQDGKEVLIASADGTAQLFDLENHEHLATFDAHQGPVVSAAFSPDGKTIVTAHDDAPRLWNASAGRPMRTLSLDSSEIHAAAFTSDGKSIVTATDNPGTLVWDLASWASRVGFKDKTNDPLLNPGGRRILTATSDEKAVLVADSLTGKLIATIDLPEDGSLTGLAFSRDGERLFLASGPAARIWDITHGKLIATLEGHRGTIVDGSFSPDGRTFVTASEDGTSRLWSLSNGRLLRTLDGASSERLTETFTGTRSEDKPIVTAAFSHDGSIIATAAADGTIRMWNAQSGRPIGTPLRHDGVKKIVFSPQENIALTLGSDERAHLWDARTGRSIATLSGHRGTVNEAAFSPDGRLLATSGFDGSIRLWDTATGRSLGVLDDQGWISEISFHPSGNLLLGVNFEGTALVWDVSEVRKPIDEIIAEIRHRVARDLTEDECEQSHLDPRMTASGMICVGQILPVSKTASSR